MAYQSEFGLLIASFDSTLKWILPARPRPNNANLGFDIRGFLRDGNEEALRKTRGSQRSLSGLALLLQCCC